MNTKRKSRKSLESYVSQSTKEYFFYDKVHHQVKKPFVLTHLDSLMAGKFKFVNSKFKAMKIWSERKISAGNSFNIQDTLGMNERPN